MSLGACLSTEVPADNHRFQQGLDPISGTLSYTPNPRFREGPGYFRRIGSSKREMSPELLARLFQERSQSRLIRFDESVIPRTASYV